MKGLSLCAQLIPKHGFCKRVFKTFIEKEKLSKYDKTAAINTPRKGFVCIISSFVRCIHVFKAFIEKENLSKYDKTAAINALLRGKDSSVSSFYLSAAYMNRKSATNMYQPNRLLIQSSLILGRSQPAIIQCFSPLRTSQLLPNLSHPLLRRASTSTEISFYISRVYQLSAEGILFRVIIITRGLTCLVNS